MSQIVHNAFTEQVDKVASNNRVLSDDVITYPAGQYMMEAYISTSICFPHLYETPIFPHIAAK